MLGRHRNVMSRLTQKWLKQSHSVFVEQLWDYFVADPGVS